MSSADIPTDSSVATGETSANVSSAPQPPHKRRLIIIIGVVVIVLAAAGGGYYFWHKSQHKVTPPAATDQSAAANTAIQQANNGNSTQALNTINSAIKSTSDKSQKSALYTQQGNIYQNDNNYQAATTSYQNAAQTDGLTYALAQSIAESAQAAGNKQLAIEYYQKAIALVPANDPTGGAEKNAFQASINQLGGQ